MTITSTEANRMMDFATFIYLRNGGRPDVNEATEFAREMFREFCAIESITDVNCENEEEDNEAYEEEYDIEMGFNPYIGGYDYDC